MIIGSCHNLGKIDKDPVIKIDSETVNRFHTSKSLGVIIDDKLKWEDQIDSISKNVSCGIGAIKFMKPYVPKKCLTQVYNALIQPCFDYCSLVWQNCKLQSCAKMFWKSFPLRFLAYFLPPPLTVLIFLSAQTSGTPK